MAFDFIDAALAARKEQGLLRRRTVIDDAQGPLIEVDGQHYLNFSSNDYLGMRRSTVVAQAWVDGVSEFGGGSGASPLVTGYTHVHQALEVYLAEQLGRDKAILFNSGFAANQALCQALFAADNSSRRSASIGKTSTGSQRASKYSPQSHILADKLMHASFLDGATSCDATLKRFKHNDMTHFAKCLASIPDQADTLVATEGVFSMDGDMGPVADMATQLQNSNCWLMVDDAHGFGVLGEKGLGVTEQAGLTQQQLPVVMATFGKAIGTAGAFIAGSESLIDYLMNFSRHYIYSTAMPAAQAYATLASLQSTTRLTNKLTLAKNIGYFRQCCQQAGIALTSSDTAIQPIIIGDASLALSVSSKLRDLGLWVGAIRYPTVPKGTDRLRITLTASHNQRDISALVDALQMVLGASGSQGRTL